MSEKPPQPIPFVHKSKNVMGVKAPGEPPYMWIRDLANVLNPVLKNCTICVQQMYEGKAEEIEILDTIVQFLKRMYITARNNSPIIGLMVYRELLEYLKPEEPKSTKDVNNSCLLFDGIAEKKAEVYTAFCQMFMLSMFAYMFGSKQMMVATPKELGTDSYDFGMFLSMMAVLPEDKRKELVKLFKSEGAMSSTFDINPLMRSAEKYLDVIKENQQRRYDEQG